LLSTALNDSFIKWSGIPRGNIFVTDTDIVDNIDWDNLKAIGRNITNGVSDSDFEEIDEKLNSTNYNDSVNLSYTSNGLPKDTKTFSILDDNISNVPVINSTINNNFVTGILWDSSDGGNEYNKSQDLVFVTEMNYNSTGKYGVYDYEIRIPVNIEKYASSTNSISFYYEIK
jgi:hypothetical protein